MYPDPLPDLYHGEPLVVALKTGDRHDAIKVQGRFGARSWQRRLKTAIASERPGIAGLWAREKIAGLMQRLALGARAEEIRSQVLNTALAHQLVSKYTSLVAVDSKIARSPGTQLKTAPIATALPHGWKAAAVFGGAVQTGTPATMYRVAGILLLLFCSMLFGIHRWRKRI